MHKLKHVPHEIETDVEEADHDTKEMGHKAKHAMSPQSSHDNEEEDDEGWASDHSVNQQRNTSASTITDGKKQTKSPKPKFLPKPVGKGRRRSSMRKGVFGRAHLLRQKQPESSSAFEDSDGEDSDDHRGRRETALAGPADGLVSRGSLRSIRIDSIRGIDARREESPVRSIRFVGDEENRSGANTPRLSILQDSSSGSPHQGSIDDTDSPKNKVTFDLSGSDKT